MKILGLLTVAVVYWLCLPSTVQTLDTGEVVASAFARTVPHPPGFPLYIWLQHIFIHVFAIGTVFWRAALFTMLLSVASLALMTRFTRGRLYFWICLIPLAMWAPYWRYSVLPDVFSLNLFFLVAIALVYFWGGRGVHRLAALFVLFALGGLNHPSIIFVLPFLLEACIEQFQFSKNTPRTLAQVTGFAVVAIALFVSGYASLLFLNPDSLFSWGHLRSATDIAAHALRSEFGSFQLTGKTDTADFSKTFGTFAVMIAQGIPFALLLALAPLGFKPFGLPAPPRRYFFGLASLALYIAVFFTRANSPIESILERFFLFPAVLIVLLSGFALPTIESLLERKLRRSMIGALGAAGVAIGIMNGVGHWRANDFSWNTIVEDYARNLLNMSTDDQRTVFIVDGDTRCFATRYVQAVEGIHKDALVLCVGMIFHKAHMAKLRIARPDFVFDPGWNEGLHARDVIHNVVKPNITNYQFIMTDRVNTSDFHVIFLGLGRRLSKLSAASPTELDPDSLTRIVRRSDPSRLAPSSQPDELKMLFADYAFYFLKEGLLAANKEAALRSFEKAIEIVPYCLPAIQNRCALLSDLGRDATECRRVLENTSAYDPGYF